MYERGVNESSGGILMDGIRELNSDYGICVGHMSYQKKPCLFVHHGNTMTRVASFSNEESAELFKQALDKMFPNAKEVGYYDWIEKQG